MWTHFCRIYGTKYQRIRLGPDQDGPRVAYLETELCSLDSGEQYKGLKLGSDISRFLSQRDNCGSNLKNKVEGARIKVEKTDWKTALMAKVQASPGKI